MARIILIILVLAALVLIILFATGRFNVDQTRPAQLPKISAEGGQLPAFDVQTDNLNLPNVDINTGNDAGTTQGGVTTVGDNEAQANRQ
jgi:hypothetical protein